jgi:hypothetical protein
VGAIHPGTYFFFPIRPGEHHLCARGQRGIVARVALYGLKAESGETYYFVPDFVSAYGTGFNLSPVNPDEGKDLVARSKFSTSHPK